MTVLKDTSLCAIVRDEMINPAQLLGKSGIRSFVESHAPHVDQAIIVDTGSIDGTREELEQLTSEFPNLRVYDRPFDDYASARNHSLSYVETSRVLVLDVDELITQQNFERLTGEIKSAEEVNPKMKLSIPYFFYFSFSKIMSDGIADYCPAHNIRLFKREGVQFRNVFDRTGEYLYKKNSRQKIRQYDPHVVSINTEILHFMPGECEGKGCLDLMILKGNEWYDLPSYSESPSRRKHFKLWKQPNPFREKYK
jgi:glycosyltransferase involved in cell wall biosynthesis